MGAALFSCTAVPSPCLGPTRPLKGPATRGPHRKPNPTGRATSPLRTAAERPLCPPRPVKCKTKAPLPTLGAALFFMSGGSISVSAPAAERHHAAARTKVPPRSTSGPAPQLTPKARQSPTAPSGGAGAGMSAKRPNDGQEPNGIRAKSLSLAIPSEAGGTRGIREAPPKKRQAEAKRHPGMDLSHAIPSKADRKPEAPAKAANRGEGGTEGKGGKEEGKEKRGKEARKQESRKAGKQEAGKRGSREAGKPGSGRRHKKRRRTVGCTSACGSQQSLAYRNYLLR